MDTSEITTTPRNRGSFNELHDRQPAQLVAEEVAYLSVLIINIDSKRIHGKTLLCSCGYQRIMDVALALLMVIKMGDDP